MTTNNAMNDTLSGGSITGTNVVSYTETIITANSGTAYTFDFSLSRTWVITLTGNVTFSVSNVPATGAVPITIHLIQDATGSRTVTWPASFNWPAATAPTITTTATHRDIYVGETTNGGTSFQMMTLAQNYSS